jgi:hypothetical protein
LTTALELLGHAEPPKTVGIYFQVFDIEIDQIIKIAAAQAIT